MFFGWKIWVRQPRTITLLAWRNLNIGIGAAKPPKVRVMSTASSLRQDVGGNPTKDPKYQAITVVLMYFPFHCKMLQCFDGLTNVSKDV